MATKLKKFLKSFTLIELIIVIAIIAVLGVAAFLVLTQWMSKGRDAQRISDLATIKTGLDIALSKNDELPLPDEANELLYSGTEILYQGKFGDSVVAQIGTLNKVPRDRVNGEYDYSLLDDKITYKIRAQIENEQYKMSYLNLVRASNDFYRYIGKDIKGKIIEGKFVYLPSMFITGYVNNQYDLLSGTNVFQGETTNKILTGGVSDNNKEAIISMFSQLGVDEDGAIKIYSTTQGAQMCEGTLPANAELNGTQKSGTNWSYSQTQGECKYKCIDGYHHSNGECLIDDGWYGNTTNGYYYYEGGEIKYPLSCNDLLVSTGVNYLTGNELPVNGTGFISGFYLIKPDLSDSYKVYCEMQLNGGGWMRLDKYSAKGGTIIQGVGTINNSFEGIGNLVSYYGNVGGDCGVSNSIRSWAITDSIYNTYKPQNSYATIYMKTTSKTAIDCGPRGCLNKSTSSDGFYRPIENNLTTKCSVGGGFGTYYYNGINGYAAYNLHESGILQTKSTYNSSHDISKSIARFCITCGSGNVTINLVNVYIK